MKSTYVTVSLQFWKRHGSKSPPNFIWREVTESFEVGVGYEDRVKEFVRTIESQGWRVFWPKCRVVKYH